MIFRNYTPALIKTSLERIAASVVLKVYSFTFVSGTITPTRIIRFTLSVGISFSLCQISFLFPISLWERLNIFKRKPRAPPLKSELIFLFRKEIKIAESVFALLSVFFFQFLYFVDVNFS